MSDYIRLPRSALELIPSALYRGILVCLLEKADDNGRLSIGVRGLADEIGVSYQTLRTAILKLSRNAIINATPTHQLTQRLTQITICDYDDYINSKNKPQRSRQRTSNAASNAVVCKTEPKKFNPPTREEAQAYIDKMNFHWGDADLFIDFNEQKGWRLSDGSPMRDWKAAMRNWENRWKQKFKNGELRTQTTDKYAARRGTDVGNHTEADYGGPF